MQRLYFAGFKFDARSKAACWRGLSCASVRAQKSFDS